jgi:hypothetical protein
LRNARTRRPIFSEKGSGSTRRGMGPDRTGTVGLNVARDKPPSCQHAAHSSQKMKGFPYGEPASTSGASSITISVG